MTRATEVLLDGLCFGEGPRWHDGKLWFSDMHAHRVMTAGRLNGALVDYGLGNFAFYNESGLSGVTGVLRVTVTGRDVDAYE